MSSCVYILDELLEPLISKNTKPVNNVSDIIKRFKDSWTPTAPPIITIAEWHYVYLKRDSLWFVTAIHQLDDRYTNLMMVLFYLDQLYVLLKTYFRKKLLTKTLIIDNALLVTELIDESIDFGIIQMTDPSIIHDYIRLKINKLISHDEDNSDSEDSDDENESGTSSTKKNNKSIGAYIPNTGSLTNLWRGSSQKNQKKTDENTDSDDDLNNDDETYINSHIARTTTMAVSWRTKGIYYAKNEFFLDVIENVQYLLDFKQKVIRKNLIHGKIQCKSYLSGMPTLKIALNKILQGDQQFIDHAKFHQCVSLKSIDIQEQDFKNEEPESIATEDIVNKKEIEFIPPDGEFILCQYELKRHVKDPPVIDMTSYEIKTNLRKHRVQIHVAIETHFKRQNTTSSLTIKIPLIDIFTDYKIDLTKQPRFKCDIGKVLFDISEDFLIWEVGSIKGGRGEVQKSMAAEFFIFNQEEYDRQQEELKTSMNPPPLREGPKLEEIYEQLHENDDDDEDAIQRKKKQYVFMTFEIPYSTCSGLKVEYLKIEEDMLNYQAFPWVRYKTVNDDEYAYIV